MHNNNSSVISDNNTNNYSAHYSAKDEECNVHPLLRPAVSSNDMQRDALHRPRSTSLFDTVEDHHSVLKLTTSGSGLDVNELPEALFPDDNLEAPPLTLPNSANRRCTRLNTLLLEAAKHRDVNEIERLIKAGANPNATCRVHCVSVCHLAAMRTDNALTVLLNAGAERNRFDRLGRTPLHLAAWAGNVRQIAVLLGFSEDLQNRLAEEEMTIATEEEVKKLRPDIKELVNVKCDFRTSKTKLPSYWMDNAVDHNCKEFERSLPIFQLGWSALHAASARGQSRCARLLIAAGSDLGSCDLVGRTPLEIAGSAYYDDQNIDPQNFADLVRVLISSNCKNFKIENRKIVDTPLHTAVEMGSLEAVLMLVTKKLPVN